MSFDDVRNVCLALFASNDIPDSYEQLIYEKSAEQNDPLFWYLRKCLFILSMQPENLVTVNFYDDLTDDCEWTEQLASIGSDRQLLNKVLDSRVPYELLDHSQPSYVVIHQRYRSMGLDESMVDSLYKGIIHYAYLIAVEKDIPCDHADVRFKTIIRSKHSMILGSMLHIDVDRLLETVLHSKVSAYDLAFMTRKQLLPNFHEKLVKDLLKRLEAEDAGVVDPEKMDDGFYECNRCHRKKTRYEAIQIRSADEPMTHFVRCYVCRITWKED